MQSLDQWWPVRRVLDGLAQVSMKAYSSTLGCSLQRNPIQKRAATLKEEVLFRIALN